MILIFAVDNNWNIGYDGNLLYKISEDLKRFRRLTEGNIIIMGRKTFESLPDKKALPNRINIVITRDKEYRAEGARVINSLKELFPLLNELNPNNEMENFIIGGGEIAKQTISYCNKAYITKIFKTFEKADAFIPNLDLLHDWGIIKESDIYKQDDLEYKYVDYIRVK
ncbi:dihydrofolate reductase [Tissierella praeacuta DSM 18095]|uniref:dihydrofolate reductase n=1 Tax=Tissierella praeacuta DSM 18095 TaxID=1123404 RepID=A0A1M4TGK0_9FIRM|nr:dihydrofolate reductase [Tissierella praeacuta]TCU77528.1 dihydrofolate reductase [Tissierella praeacuta]SHE43622.1 dihydrofolate reductase [Tissierella praeacuta DSM 18095]SUP04648.1 Dihydrofolate reductase [Tissierella praeacuta]